jgi:adenylate kinase family enzyme
LEKKDRDTRIDILEKLVMDKQWIIEGAYPLSSELALRAADTIIFLDIPSLLCLLRVFKRHQQEQGRRDLPEGCTDKLDLHLIWKVLTFRFQGGRTFKQMLDYHGQKQAIILLRSPQWVKEFLAQQIHTIDDKKCSSNRSALVSATIRT